MEKGELMTADRERIVNNLASLMRKKLSLPRCIEKGDNWLELTTIELLNRLLDEFHELISAVNERDKSKVIDEIADCANYLAMLNDKMIYMDFTKYMAKDEINETHD
jgi:NTP pyrophosphatase (non-canonical NTP hydrolase)